MKGKEGNERKIIKNFRESWNRFFSMKKKLDIPNKKEGKNDFFVAGIAGSLWTGEILSFFKKIKEDRAIFICDSGCYPRLFSIIKVTGKEKRPYLDKEIESLLNYFDGKLDNFLSSRNLLPYKKLDSLKKDKEEVKSEFINQMLKGKSYQIMGQSRPEEKGEDEDEDDSLYDYLVDCEQIPEEGESVDEFLERTNWTLEEENKWRKIDGLPPLKSKEEYKELFEE